MAAKEVLARDMKALGRYAAKSLSCEGVVYELLEHQLTQEQIRIYDAYARAFQIIHDHLDAALKAANITGDTGTLNGQAKSAARSAFQGAKQRFFNHLINPGRTHRREAPETRARAAEAILYSATNSSAEERSLRRARHQLRLYAFVT
jgi:predicted alpha-1,6-mannanase (GH76 family)